MQTPIPINPFSRTLAQLPLPAKVLITAIVLVMGSAMIGALGQVVVHDIIPTFFENEVDHTRHNENTAALTLKDSDRGDLFGDIMEQETPPQPLPIHKTDEFIWLLKWSHIHLFGMNMIFIFMGGVALFLNYPLRTRAWLIGLPFAGVLVDILAMWLKVYVSPVFFWLHVPGGGLFGFIFGWVSLRALFEMWMIPGQKKIG